MHHERIRPIHFIDFKRFETEQYQVNMSNILLISEQYRTIYTPIYYRYEFTDEEALKTASEFLTAINDLSSYYKQRGEALVQGDKFLRSVCF